MMQIVGVVWVIISWEVFSAFFFPIISGHQLAIAHSERELLLRQVQTLRDEVKAAKEKRADHRAAFAAAIVSGCRLDLETLTVHSRQLQ